MPSSWFLSDAEVYDLFDHFVSTDTWIGLAYDSPFGNRADQVEISGGGYSRKLVDWQRTVRSVTSNSSLVWEDIPSAALVTWVVGFTAETGGRLRFGVPLTDPSFFRGSHVSFEIPKGALVVGLDVEIT